MSRSGVLVVVGAAAAILAACAGDEQQEPREKPKAFHPPVEILERYDLDHDGTLTRAEMEKGLRVEFDAADRKHTGCLDADETAAVNESRWAEGLSTTSTIVDWNHDGCVDFNEFANTARSLFDQVDRKGTGVLTPELLHPEKRLDKKSAPMQTP